jgi:acyl transferase domain-containing protein
LQKNPKVSNIHKAELCQPLCTAIQIALYHVLLRLGVKPKAVVGHSSGEIAASYASGALTLPEALITAYYRGFVAKSQTLAGGMAAIGLGPSATLKYLTKGVVISCENSPNSTTISGDVDQLDKVLAAVRENSPDVLARRLKVDMAYHSRKHPPPSISVSG